MIFKFINNYKLNRSNSGLKRSWLLGFLSLISGLATFIAMTPSGNANKFLILLLLNIDLILLVSLIIIITKRIVNIWSRKKSGQLGAQLHSKVVVMFCLDHIFTIRFVIIIIKLIKRTKSIFSNNKIKNLFAFPDGVIAIKVAKPDINDKNPNNQDLFNPELLLLSL